MTADEVKDAHDRIWAVKDKLGILHIAIIVAKTPYKIVHSIALTYERTKYNYQGKHFLFTSEVNQFLKELG